MNVHRYWSGDRPRPDAQLPDPVVDWTDDDVPLEYLHLADTTAHLVVPDPRQQLRHRANVVRLGLLYEHGGWWADYDLTALASFSTLPSVATASHGTTRCNCWLAFPARHPCLRTALDAIADQPDAEPRLSVYVAGEEFLTALWSPEEVPHVPVFVDVNGSTNPGAPPVLIHAGTTANQKPF